MSNEPASERGKAHARKDLTDFARRWLRPSEGITDSDLELVRQIIVKYPGNIDTIRKDGLSIVGSDFHEWASPIEFGAFVEGYISRLLQPFV